jgi:hypothetical protein
MSTQKPVRIGYFTQPTKELVKEAYWLNLTALGSVPLLPQTKWVNKIRAVSPTLPLLAPKIVEHVLEEIQNALLADLKIEARYQSSTSDQPKSYLINPLALIQRGLITYLVATVVDFTDIRLFALHRFKQAVKTENKAIIPGGFNLDTYIEEGHLNFGPGKESVFNFYRCYNLGPSIIFSIMKN